MEQMNTMLSSPPHAMPTMLSGMRDLATRYDGFLLDQWGVLHDGGKPFPGAIDCLERLREAGKRIVILSNSGRTGESNARTMLSLGIGGHLYDAVVTAGDAAREAFRARSDPFHRELGMRALMIAKDEDLAHAGEFGVTAVDDVAAADLVLVVNLPLGHRSVDDYAPLLAAARARDLPLVCANPDVVVVHPGAVVVDAAGAVAERYEAMGGRVRYHGKPHPGVYALGMARLGVAAPRVLAVGDSMAHDVAGAHGAGVDCAFIVGGIHREALGVPAGELPDPAGWPAFAAAAGESPEYVVAMFRW